MFTYVVPLNDFPLSHWYCRLHGLPDSMLISISLILTTSGKLCTVLFLGYGILSSLFALTQFLHCDLLLKLAEVHACIFTFPLSFHLLSHFLPFVFLYLFPFPFYCKTCLRKLHFAWKSDLNEIRPILPQLLDGMWYWEPFCVVWSQYGVLLIASNAWICRVFQAYEWGWEWGPCFHIGDNCRQIWGGDGTICAWIMPEFGNESGLIFLHCCFSCLLEILTTRFTTGFCILEVYELRWSWWWRWWSWCSGCCWLFACHKHDPWVSEQASSPLHPNWTNFAAHNA